MANECQRRYRGSTYLARITVNTPGRVVPALTTTMKATIEFNLPDDQEDFQDAVNGQKWRLMVWDFDQKLRSQLKYNDKLSSEQYKVYEEIRDLLYQKMNEDGLSLD